MEWLIIPGIVVGLVVLLFGIGIAIGVKTNWDMDTFFIASIIFSLFAFMVTIVACPITYYSTRTDALRMEAYYEQIITPAIVEEYDDYVVVNSTETAIWQAGEMNLAGYNAYLQSTRYWDGVPVIGSAVFGPPEQLKFVRVQ